MCQEKIKYETIGYESTSKECSRESKWVVSWKNISGTHTKEYCSLHKNRNVVYIEYSPFEILLSVKEIK